MKYQQHFYRLCDKKSRQETLGMSVMLMRLGRSCNSASTHQPSYRYLCLQGSQDFCTLHLLLALPVGGSQLSLHALEPPGEKAVLAAVLSHLGPQLCSQQGRPFPVIS